MLSSLHELVVVASSMNQIDDDITIGSLIMIEKSHLTYMLASDVFKEINESRRSRYAGDLHFDKPYLTMVVSIVKLKDDSHVFGFLHDGVIYYRHLIRGLKDGRFDARWSFPYFVQMVSDHRDNFKVQ